MSLSPIYVRLSLEVYNMGVTTKFKEGEFCGWIVTWMDIVDLIVIDLHNLIMTCTHTSPINPLHRNHSSIAHQLGSYCNINIRHSDMDPT